jgi:hypothetical protein
MITRNKVLMQPCICVQVAAQIKADREALDLHGDAVTLANEQFFSNCSHRHNQAAFNNRPNQTELRFVKFQVELRIEHWQVCECC